MKKFFLLLTIAGLSVLLPVSAQEQQTNEYHNLKIAIEFGINIMDTKLAKPEQIRENRFSGYYYYTDGYYNYGFMEDYNSLSTIYIGVKPEFFVFNNRIGIASGLRFTMAPSKLVSDRDNFLWKIDGDNFNTHYVRINDICQKNYLIGVPFEIRFFPNKRELPVQHYFKLGASFNYIIYSEYQVNFTSKAMKKYDDLIQKQLPENSVFSVFCFGAVGFKIGKFKEGRMIPWGNVEFQFPYVVLTKKSFAFAGKQTIVDFPSVGFQCSFQIPIGKNVPIGSKLINF